ncbi:MULTISPECIES: hypothetical protein [Allobacillus]|uniref:Uncharacterized protein n=1 Tax=Allobacillus salarius TaxID=1955272 RepID=A0A556PPI3_9BACI|nr:hypothetical protein [Allobacillus salarius]TSJ66255.1 hypothetical protein FPQ13_05155 [Allobacillus salarius]
MRKITFEDISKALGISEEAARVSLSTPIVSDSVLLIRAERIAKLILQRKRLSDHIQLSVVSDNKICCVASDVKLEFSKQMLSGHKDAIVQRIRKMESNLAS